MTVSNPYQAYQKRAIQTAKPEDLTLMLYEGIVKFVRLAKIALENMNFEEANRNNLQAQNILGELMITLKSGYEVSESMMAIYDYLKRRLIDANVSRSMDLLNEVEGFAVEFVETWSAAMKKAKA